MQQTIPYDTNMCSPAPLAKQCPDQNESVHKQEADEEEQSQQAGGAHHIN